jgi:hypothetical protein
MLQFANSWLLPEISPSLVAARQQWRIADIPWMGGRK